MKSPKQGDLYQLGTHLLYCGDSEDARSIRNHTLPGEWVYDPFVGSGTTLIAAELLKRKCLAVELNPECVSMTILRWEILTGLKAHKK